MKKTNLLLGILIGLTILSCSKENTTCDDILEPQGNEFTVNCNRYKMELGRLNINGNAYSGMASCKLSFVNNEKGNGFDFQSNDKNINFVDIWLMIPSEYILLEAIPEGTYVLNNETAGQPNQPQAPFDIADWNRAIIGAGYVEDNDKFINHTLYGSDFDEATVVVSKSGLVYEIYYTLKISETTIKGYYKGELEVVDKWN